jgi:hypothetical protein
MGKTGGHVICSDKVNKLIPISLDLHHHWWAIEIEDTSLSPEFPSPPTLPDIISDNFSKVKSR